MAKFCLPTKDVKNFLEAIKTGKIDPQKMSTMTSEQRREMLDGVVGKGFGKDVNALFESKLLLKNQQHAYVTWAKTVAGMKPEVRRDLVSRIEKMDKVLDGKTADDFMTDLAEQKLGVGVTAAEAQKIADLSHEVQKNSEKNGSANYNDRMEYGRAVYDLTEYVGDLKAKAGGLTLEDAKTRPGHTTLRIVSEIPGFTKAMQAAFDNSSPLSIGLKTLFAHPKIWQRNTRKTFTDIAKTFGGKPVQRETMAEIVSRPTYPEMKKAGLAVGVREEDFISHLPEKIPYLRRAYSASQNAFSGFAQRMRADVFDAYLKVAERNGYEWTEQDLKNVGRMVNSMTSRGYLGSLEKAADFTNLAFFSARNQKSHFDYLVGDMLGGGASAKEMLSGDNMGTRFVRKQAAKNLLKTVTGIATVLGIAKAIDDDSVDFDPRSANFGKIKVGNTRVSVTGGMDSLVVLASRLITGETKSSTTGKITKINERDKDGKLKFGTKTGFDLGMDFIGNKLSPLAGEVIRDPLKGERMDGGKPFSIVDPTTYAPTGLRLVTPLPIQNAQEILADPNSAPIVAAMLLDGLGAYTNTYGGSKGTQEEIKKARARGDMKEVERLQILLELELKGEREREKKRKEENKVKK